MASRKRYVPTLDTPPENAAVEIATQLIRDHVSFIFKEMNKHMKEVYGQITSDLTFHYVGAGSEVVTPPTTSECFAPWHSHLPMNVLRFQDEDIYFNPPSMADIYYCILGAALKKYYYSFVVAIEGMYIIHPQAKVIEQAKYELRKMIASPNPWFMPAEPIFDEFGLHGFNFHGAEDKFPYLSELLSTETSWEFDNFEEAFRSYQSRLEHLGVTITFVPFEKTHAVHDEQEHEHEESIATRPVIPSIVDIEGTDSDVFMREVNTWPNTRINVLEKTRKLLNRRFKAKHTREIEMEKWFADVAYVGSGLGGVVFKACIREWDAELTPVEPEHCVQYKLPDAADPTKAHAVHLIIKTMSNLDGEPLHEGMLHAAHTADFKTYVGDTNPVREITIGKLLNQLVVQGITPHMPLIYESFTILAVEEDGTINPEGNMPSFATELAHMSLANFIKSKIMHESSPAEIVELLDVVLLQLADGMLCAQKHYDFRHNDFHANNAMMTFITDTAYTYKVNGAYYTIPNYGMCWKVIDFGLSSARALHEHDVSHTFMHSPALGARLDVIFSDYAAELYDLLRLVTVAKVHTDELPEAKRKVVEKRLDDYADMLKDISSNSSKRGSLKVAYDHYVRNALRPIDSPLLQASYKFSALMRSSGLVDAFFERLASRFKVAEQPSGVVFDASKSPFDAFPQGISFEV